MTQHQLNHAVARATGESLATISRLGFGIADPKVVCHDPEPPRRPRIVNWDRLDAGRGAYLPQRARCRPKSVMTNNLAIPNIKENTHCLPSPAARPSNSVRCCDVPSASRPWPRPRFHRRCGRAQREGQCTPTSPSSTTYPASTPTETLWLPFQFLADCEGKKDEPVELEAAGKGRCTAQLARRQRAAARRVRLGPRRMTPTSSPRCPRRCRKPAVVPAGLHRGQRHGRSQLGPLRPGLRPAPG